MTVERYIPALREYILRSSEQMTREPEGIITHPYIVPSSPDSPYYSKSLWDWDSWLISVAMGQVEAELDEPGKFALYEQGAILNFLEHTGDDGVMPVQMKPEGYLRHGSYGTEEEYALHQNMHKPVLAQQVAALVRRNRDIKFIRPHMEKLGAFLSRYLSHHIHEATGLAYWQTDFAVGVDNDPSVFYRPDKSTASIYLNSLLYRELIAYGYLLEELDDLKSANVWRGRAQDLADAITTHCWDERDGTFYSVDLNLRPVDEGDWLHSGAPRHWDSLLIRVDNWSSFLPLWAGFATRAQADRMLLKYRDTETFNATYGVRTLSRLEKMYDLRASNNPSNWLGPIWGISNYLVFRGLQKYGFAEDARQLAEKTVLLFGQDLEANGCLHEYYNPDSGEPIMTRNFQNWNFLVLQLIAYLEDRPMVTEY